MILKLDTGKKPEQPAKPADKVAIYTPPDPGDITPSSDKITEKERKDLLIRQIEEKDAYLRHQRAMLHRNYRKLVNDKMEPTGSREQFIELYEQIESFTEDLKRLWIKKEQVLKYGEIRPQKMLTNEDLAKIAALKHQRARVNDNLYRHRKNLQIAINTGNTTKEKNATTKIAQLELEYLEISEELKKLEDAK